MNVELSMIFLFRNTRQKDKTDTNIKTLYSKGDQYVYEKDAVEVSLYQREETQKQKKEESHHVINAGVKQTVRKHKPE